MDSSDGPTPPTPSHRALVLQGVAWTALFQVFQIAVQFGSMIVLVRIIPPVEYGRVSAVLSFLVVLNAFSCANFMAQGLQLPEGEEPDWTAHFRAGLYLQLGLSAAAHLIAGVLWLSEYYRPIAPLLHVGAVGLLVDWPSQLRQAMLRREMNFRRYRIVLAVATLCGTAVNIGFGVAGFGAFAIVLGSNVTPAIPFALDLLLVRRWRPRAGWWRWPDWRTYRPALHFGVQQAGGALLAASKGVVTAAVLPPSLGLIAMGLLNRAQGLLGTTVGRVQAMLIETVYPLLPRYAADRARYPRQATLFAKALMWIVMPATIFLGIAGPQVSHLLYGQKWIAVDPLLGPAAAASLGILVASIGGGVLLAAGRLRVCFMLSVLGALLTLPMVSVVALGGGLSAYAWTQGICQGIAGVVALWAARQYLSPGWLGSVVLPPACASGCAAVATVAVDQIVEGLPLGVRVGALVAVFGAVVTLVLRVGFARELAPVVSRLPGGARLTRWLRLDGQVEHGA
ncbi:MAG TPA: oligosaccharide flippase family protein [Kofleriaceae bacterium]|nr:oligosaccharide flippase family protein [Kofleriaceae bacterium]